MVEFESLGTGKKVGLHRIGSSNRVLGFARGWNEEEIQVYAKFLEILLGAKIEEVKDILSRWKRLKVPRPSETRADRNTKRV